MRFLVFLAIVPASFDSTGKDDKSIDSSKSNWFILFWFLESKTPGITTTQQSPSTIKRTEAAPSSAHTNDTNKKSVKADEQKSKKSDEQKGKTDKGEEERSTPKKTDAVEKSNRIFSYFIMKNFNP